MSELTREQVEEVFNAVYWHEDQQETKQNQVLDFIDTLRARVAELEAELAELKGNHCKDCCCARSWEALEVTGPTGMSIVEHIERLKAERDAAVQEAGRLREALSLLYDHQNGCPLPKYEPQWNEAMRLTERALNLQQPRGRSGDVTYLGKQLATRSLTWTTAKPTAAGNYWFREGPDDHEPWVVRVVEWETHVIDGGEWAGPIPLPREA